MSEWIDKQKWNPFNSYKLLAHIDRWKYIGMYPENIPAPILVTVDPNNTCNLDCVWCNASKVRTERKTLLSEKTLLNLADYLGQWRNWNDNFKVLSVCIAGGGEPLFNPYISEFIDRLIVNDIDVGIVTNGTTINRYVDALSKCVWVGVSIDAAKTNTYQKLKRTNYSIENVHNNIELLIDYSQKHNTKLTMPHRSYGVSYKYLLYGDNVNEVFKATKIAKKIGCKNIHFRPASTTWDKLDNDEIIFTRNLIRTFEKQIGMAQSLADDNFGVYGISHKFDSQFKRQFNFEKCWAAFMTCVFMPRSNQSIDNDAFTMGLCCDRRGDTKLELLTDCTDINMIESAWGNKKHWEIHNSINPCKECPRCTYAPHNEIYEQVILKDNMTYKFI